MTIVLYHHPYSRASNVIWMLEEAGVPYELRFVDIMKGEQKSKELIAINPMGKIPVLTDGDAVVTEGAAIALYLADRYAYGTLAPKVDDPRRGTYLRWALFAPSVIEPGSMAKAEGIKHFETSQLLDPNVNIQLGCRYLKQTMDKFGGQPEYVFAAYNAGDARVIDWRSGAGEQGIDEFVESIPFTETRDYVQAIVRNAEVYKRVYGTP